MMELDRRTRSKIIVEITVSHVRGFAAEAGLKLSDNEAIALLNQGDLAQRLWLQMMQAAEQYTKTAVMIGRAPRSMSQGPR